MELCLGMGIQQAPKMSLQQHQGLVLGQELSIRCELLLALRGDKYEPDGKCEQCGRKLTPAEIISGFSRDPQDFTTRCTGCGHRFQPKLICVGAGGASTIELPFFCDAQMLNQLRDLEQLEPEQIAHDRPAVYRAAIFHRGTLKAAFAAIDIEYVLEKPLDWRNKLAPFLGKLPDTIIAKYAGITVFKVRSMRRKLGIGAYSKAQALEDVGDPE